MVVRSLDDCFNAAVISQLNNPTGGLMLPSANSGSNCSAKRTNRASLPGFSNFVSSSRRLGLLILLTVLLGLLHIEHAYAQASPGCGAGTCVSTGTRLVGLNSDDSQLLNATLGSMLGTHV